MTLLDFGSDYQSKQNLNANNVAIRAAFDNTVSRDGTSPNQMTNTLDMNGNRIIGLANPTGAGTDAVNVNYLASALAAFVNPAPITTSVAASVLNYAALRAYSLTGLPDGAIFYCQGFGATQDGGQGFWRLTSVNPGADNAGTRLASNTAGKYFVRQFEGPVIDLWFGVKADGATDNTAALQAAEDYANAAFKPIYYPSQANDRIVLSPITTYPGIHHFGDGIAMIGYSEGLTTGYGRSHIRKPSGTTPVFQCQTTTGTYLAMPGPTWKDMNITCTAGQCIVLNSNSGGFTDDLTTQAAFNDVIIQNVAFYIGNGSSGRNGLELYKVFNSKIEGCFFNGGISTIYLKGSDNVLVQRNVFENASTNSIQGDAAGTTFSNMLWIKDNIFLGSFLTMRSHITTSYQIFHIIDNFFEPVNTVTVAAIELVAGIEGNVRGNFFNLAGIPIPSWLSVSGVFLQLNLTDNSFAATTGAAVFNAGTGHKAYYNSTTKAQIFASGNSSAAGIPFINLPDPGSLTGAPATAGSIYWDFRPQYSALDGSAGAYAGASLMIFGGAYILSPGVGTANRIGWTGPISPITDTVDVWVCVYCPTVNQTLSVEFNGATTTQAITYNAGLVWYKIANNVVAVAANTLRAYNADTVRNTDIRLYAIQVIKH